MIRTLVIMGIVSFFLQACRTVKFVQDEGKYIPSSNESVWWLINTFSADHNRENATSIFMMIKKSEHSFFGDFYLADFSQPKPYSFYNSEKLIFKDNRFPVEAVIPYNDSLKGGLIWSLNRNSFKLITKADKGKVSKQIKYEFSEKNPYEFLSMNDTLGMWNCKPQLVMRNDEVVEANQIQFIHKFDSGNLLLEKARKSEVILIDIVLESNEKYSFLISNSDSSGLEFQIGDDFGTTRLPQEGKLSAQAVSERKYSKSSGKYYSLRLNLMIGQRKLVLQPKRPEAEFPMKKNSFWMGEIRIFDPKDNKIVGTGIMINFKF